MAKKKKVTITKTHKIINAVDVFLTIFIPLIALIWVAGMLIGLFKPGGDISFLLTYGEICLTLFGFCLISGIFEKRERAKTKIIYELFHLSLVFLAAAISFFVLHSTLVIPSSDSIFTNGAIAILRVLSGVIGFCGVAYGLLILFLVLLRYSKEM